MKTKLKKYLSVVLCILMLMESNVFPQIASADGQVAAPVLSPSGCTYTSAQIVSMTCSTYGATIRYTTDGSNPSSTSLVYSAPITVSATTTLKAYAAAAGMTDSAIASATYTIQTVSPTISPETGKSYMANQADIPVTMTPGSTTLSAIKCGASALSSSDYSDSSTKASVTPVYQDSVVSPSAVKFNMSAQADIPVTLTLNGNTLTAIKNGTYTLEQNTDYTLSGSAVTLNSTYLNKLQAGNTPLSFIFNGGNPQTLIVNAVSSIELITPPSPPANLKVVSKTATTVSLEWEASKDNAGVEGYSIYRDGVKVGDSNGTSYTDMTVPQNSTHTYAVKAYDKSANLSEESNSVNVTTTDTLDTLRSVHLATGYNHNLQVKSDGTVWAWGYNNCGQLGDGTDITHAASVQVKGIQDVVAVAAGSYHSIALKNDGTVWAWGENWYGQLGDGTTTTQIASTQVKDLQNAIAVAAGDSFSLALRNDGTVWAWGNNYYGQLGDSTTTNSSKPVQVKDLSNVIAVATEGDHSIALKNDGTVWAWGCNSCGQLGDGTTINSSKPVQVKDLSNVIAVAVGGSHSIALKNDGTVWAWGINWYGQLGDGTTTSSSKPVQVKDLSNVIAVAAGERHSIALKSDGTVWVWGYNSDGQLGDGTTTNSSKPMQVRDLSNVIAVAAGESHSVVVKNDGTVWAWGYNSCGQLGDGTKTSRSTPVLSKDIIAPTTPTNLSATTKDDSIILSWTASTDGDSVAGYEIYRNGIKMLSVTGTTYTDTHIELDKIYAYKVKAFDASGNMSQEVSVVLNDTEAPSTPVNLKVVSKTATTVSLEWEASKDNVWVEGYSIYRDGVKVGDSNGTSYTDMIVPQNLTYTYTVKAYDKLANLSEESSSVSVTTDTLKSVPLAAGYYHSLQVKSDGTVWEWGDNSYGQIVFGVTRHAASVQVEGIQNIVAVAAGYNRSIALKNDGTVWAWGNGTITPVQVKDLYGVIAVAAGQDHSIALKNDGTVWAWGDNWYGQLGDGTTTDSSKPVQVKDLSNVIAVAAGYNRSIALKNDGTVWAWGVNWDGQLGDGTTTSSSKPVQVKDLSNVIAVSAGGSHSIALKSDGTVWAWGANMDGQLGDGTTTNSSKPVQVKDLSNVIAVVAGGSHSIALKSDGTVCAWGYNGCEQLGDGTATNSSKPVQVKDLSNVIAVAAGGSHSIVLKNDGTVWAWGYNDYGQLGDGTKTTRSTPVLSKDVTAPTTPTNLSATIKDDSIILSWTASTDGDGIAGYEIYRNGIKMLSVTGTTYTDTHIELDKIYVYKVKAFDGSGNMSEEASVVLNDTEAPSVPANLKVVSKTATTVSLEWEASKDNVWVEGYSIYRDGVKVGDSKNISYTDIALPHNKTYTYTVKAYDKSANLSEESNLVNITTDTLKSIPLAAGYNHSVTIKSDGTVWTWGNNYYGQLGDGTTKTQIVSTQVKDLQNTIAVAAGDSFSLALRNDGTVWAWGNNYYGQLGDGTTTNSSKPVQVKDLNDVIGVSAGGSCSIALKSDGTVWAWGYNQYGQLGDGTTTNSSKPVQVKDLSNVIGVSAGGNCSIALKSDGTVWVWGYNWCGLGDGTTTNSSKPVQVKNLSNVIAVAAGDNHSVALKSDGTAWAWGDNWDGQLGDGTTTYSNKPVQVKELSDITSISVRGEHSIAIKNDGTVWAWGYNNYGQLGNGTTTYSNKPVQVKGLSDITSISAGEYHNVALESDGTVWAWGDNSGGQLGDGTVTQRTIPIASANINSLEAKENPVVKAVPQGLTGRAEQDGIKLSWTARTEDYIGGYKIYRSETLEGSYVCINSVDGRSNATYCDKNVAILKTNETDGKTFYYKVSAVDKFWNESNQSEAAGVMAKLDLVAPIVLSIEPVNGAKIGSNTYINVKAEDNLKVSSIKLQYSLDGKDNWIDVQSINGSDSATFGWTTPTTNESVYVRAIVYDTTGNESDGSPVVRYTIDRQGPSKVVGLSAVPSSSSVILNWDDVPDSDFSYFRVEHKMENGEFELIGTVNDKRGIQINNLQPDKTYIYRVCAYDLCGNRGEVSDEISVTTSEDKTAPVVTDLGPVSQRYSKSLSLSANIYDNVMVASGLFQVSRDKKVWTDIATITKSGSNVNVASSYSILDQPEGKIYIRCIAKDANGNVSSGEPVNEYIIDHTAPSKLSNIEVTKEAGCIDLLWSRGAEEDLSSFKIYRSVDGGAYSIIESGWRYLNYKDRDVQKASTYKYKVSCVDIAGNESEAYETLSYGILDDTEKPKILSVSYANNVTLPVNPKITVLAEDNYLLKSVSMKYRKAQSTDKWINVKAVDNINKYSDTAEFAWNTSGLTEGSYEVVFTAKDVSGYESDDYKATYNLNVTAPLATTVKATSLGWKVELTWNQNTEADFAGYHLLRSNEPNSNFEVLQDTKGTSYTDTNVEAGKTYYYAVESIDQYLNKSKSNVVSAIPKDEDEEKPVAAIKTDDFSIINTDVLFDSSSSTDNHKVDKVLWNFGDGTESSILNPYHKYLEAGEYSVTLTVYDSAGNSSSVKREMNVYDETSVSNINVKVIDSATGTSIGDADVVVKLPDGTEKSLTTDKSGAAKLPFHFKEGQKSGTSTAYAFKTGYTPNDKELQITAGKEDTLVIRMEKGKVVEGELTAKRMTLDEIKAAGINVTAAQNQYVYSFKISLEYSEFSAIVNSEGQILNYDECPKNLCVNTIPSEDRTQPPTVILIELPGEATLLKEFFMVNLKVKNLSESKEIVLENSNATLNVPAGLYLVKGDANQKLTPKDIQGGSTGKTSWIVRGDKPGSYSLSADFNGVLKPFDKKISATFTTSNPVVVKDNSALKLLIEVEDEKKAGDVALYRVGFENNGGTDVNMPSITMKNSTVLRSYKTNEAMTKVIDTSSEVLKSGEVLWTEYSINPEAFGEWNDIELELEKCAVEALGGMEIPTEIKKVPYGTFGRVTPKIYVIDPNTGIETECYSYNLKKNYLKTDAIMPDLKIKTSRGISGNLEVKGKCEIEIDDHLFETSQRVTTDENGEYIYKGGSINKIDFRKYEGKNTYNKDTFAIDVVPDKGIPKYFFVKVKHGPITGTFRYPSIFDDSDGESTYYYDDYYFSGDSYKYNHNLATMSLCLAMSAFGSNKKSYDPKTNEETYEHKSDNAKALLNELGFEQFEINDWFRVKPTTDSIGILAANKKEVQFDGKAYTLIAVAVRGAGYEAEWASNFKVGESGQHEGFKEAKENVLEFLKEYIKGNKISGDIKLWIVGYSRASATANLVAGALDDSKSLRESLGDSVTLDPSNIYAYCFEVPAGALRKEVCKHPYNNIFNIINPNDPVPMVAPKELGFGRYGKDYYLPSMPTITGDYNSLKNNMLNKYYLLKGAKEYIVDDFKLAAIDLEFPYIKTADAKGIQGIYLDALMDTLFPKYINRSDFNSIQDGIRETIGIYYTDMDEKKRADFGRIFVEKLKSNAAKIFISPIRRNTEDLILQLLIDSLKDVKINSFDEKKLKESAKSIVSLISDFAVHNPNLTATLINNTERLGAAHYPELCLSWMQSMDSNYDITAVPTFTDGSYRIIKINCPVDVKVYGNTGSLVAAITSNASQNINGSSIISSVNQDNEKLVYIPADADYNVEITATDNGSVNYSINEFSAEAGDVTRVTNYYNISVKKGDVLKGAIPAYSDSDRKIGTANGTSTAYTLVGANNVQITPNTDLKGTNAVEASYMIDVSANNDLYGMVTGQGIRQLGGFAKVAAQAYDGYKFIGWYINDVCISTDSEYRFCVTKDEKLVAKFIPTAGPSTTPSTTPTAGQSTTPSSTPAAGPSTTSGSTPTKETNVTPTPTKNPKLDDVASHWAKEFINKLVDKGIVSGYPDGTFKPDDCITRAEAAVIISKALGFTPEQGKNTSFADNSDIPVWAKGYIKTDIEKGFVTGYEDNTFRSSNQITRAEMAVMIIRALGKEKGNSNLLTFKDAHMIEDWAKDYIAKASELGLITGYEDNTFRPSNHITRAEVAVIVSKALEILR